MGMMMKALVKRHAEKGIWMEEVPVPQPGPNEVLIKLEKTAICGTDLHIYKWDEWSQRTIRPGLVIGHEFVGRILDWYVANGQTPATIDEDPGVKFVRGVYAEFKRRGSPTVVMGASFRSTAQIEALAGCDRLTISPDLLEKLDADHGELPRKLVAGAADGAAVTPIDAAKFAADLAADPMATEKLATGIEAFAKDLEALRERIRAAL